MARDFNGTTSEIQATITPPPDGDWTMGAWVFGDTTGEGTNGQILFLNNAGTTKVTFRAAANTWILAQVYSSTNAQVVTSSTWSLATWYCMIGTHTASDNSLDIWQGTTTAAMQQATYSTDTLGVGTYDATGTNLRIGSNATSATTWDGRQERHFCVPWKMTSDEMERYRHGSLGVLFDHGQPQFLYPLDSPTAAACEDMSGRGANGTASNLTAAEGPPAPMLWTPPKRRGVYV